MQVHVHVPLEQSPTSGDILCGQEGGPYSAKEPERLRAPPVSSNGPQQVQQINSKQGPVQFQSTCPVQRRIQDPVKKTHSDRFLN